MNYDFIIGIVLGTLVGFTINYLVSKFRKKKDYIEKIKTNISNSIEEMYQAHQLMQKSYSRLNKLHKLMNEIN